MSQRKWTGILLLVLTLALIETWGLSAFAADPHGLGGSPPITASSIGQVQALYDQSWTGVTSVDWSPDGSLIATSGDFFDGVVLVDALTGQVVREWGVPGLTSYVRWSPDGGKLAVYSEDGLHGPGWIYIYSGDGGFERRWVAHGEVGDGTVQWSPDGSTLLTTANTEFALWDADTFVEEYRDTDASTWGTSASWSPDGTKFVFGSSGGPAVYDSASRALLWESNGESSSASWSPRGDLIAAGSDSGDLSLYATNGTLYATFNTSGTSNTPFGVHTAWSPDGSMVAIATQGGIHIVDVATRSIVQTLRYPPLRVLMSDNPTGDYEADNIAWSPQGIGLASTATYSARTLRLWGIRHSTLALPMTIFGIVWAVGFVLVLHPDLLHAFRCPERAADLWRDEEPSLSLGIILILFAFASSVMFAAFMQAAGMASSLEPVPSFGWFAINGFLSAGIAAAAAVVAVVTFNEVVSPDKVSKPIHRLNGRVLGLVFSPFLFFLGLAALVEGLLLFAWTGYPGLDVPSAFLVMASILLGIGVGYSGRVAMGFRNAQRWRAWLGLAISAITSVFVFFVVFSLFVVLLNILQVPPVGEFSVFGFRIGFAFGFSPFLALLVGLVFAFLAGGWPHPLGALFGGYARIHGNEVLELDARKNVLMLIEEHPGIHFRDILRLSNLGSGTVHYHLAVLGREGIVIARREGPMKRFYPGRIPKREPLGPISE